MTHSFIYLISSPIYRCFSAFTLLTIVPTRSALSFSSIGIDHHFVLFMDRSYYAIPILSVHSLFLWIRNFIPATHRSSGFLFTIPGDPD